MQQDYCEPDTAPVERSVVLRQMMRPIAAYLADDQVRELAIPYPKTLFLKAHGQWIERDAPELSFAYLQALAAAMASYNNVNFAPIMSLKLPDGERGQVMQPPALLDGCISVNIRKHSSVVKSLDELAAEGAFDQVLADTQHSDRRRSEDDELKNLLADGRIREFLDRAVQYRRNIIIGGRTGSGKTTFARSLIERVPVTERLITIEDVHELYLPNHPNRVHMIYGPDAAQVSATDCVAACMRSSPDRIFLSELRGSEAWEYLSALNTGHPGSVTTTHANSAQDTFDRVAMLIKQSRAGGQIDIETIRRFLISTLDIVLYFAHYKLVEVYFNPERQQSLITPTRNAS